MLKRVSTTKSGEDGSSEALLNGAMGELLTAIGSMPYGCDGRGIVGECEKSGELDVAGVERYTCFSPLKDAPNALSRSAHLRGGIDGVRFGATRDCRLWWVLE